VELARNLDTPPGRAVVFAIDREAKRPGADRSILETAGKMLDQLSPADAVGAIGIPGAGIELTRDHAAVGQAIGQMTGMAPADAEYPWSWDEALRLEGVCNRVPDPCLLPMELALREMLTPGRGHAQRLAGLAPLDHLGRYEPQCHRHLNRPARDLAPAAHQMFHEGGAEPCRLFVVHRSADVDGVSNGPARRVERLRWTQYVERAPHHRRH
jgi:hypothetical protein